MKVSEKRPRHLCEDCQRDLCQSEYYEQNRVCCSDGSRNRDSNSVGSDVEDTAADIETVLSAISGLSRQISQFPESLYQKLDSMDERFVSLEHRISGLEEKRQSEPGTAETHQR